MFLVALFMPILLTAYMAWTWVDWKQADKSRVSRWRSNAILISLFCVTISSGLSAYMSLHAVVTGGYPFWHPVELFCIRYGSLTALLALITAALGKGTPRLRIAIASVFNLLVWFTDATAQ